MPKSRTKEFIQEMEVSMMTQIRSELEQYKSELDKKIESGDELSMFIKDKLEHAEDVWIENRRRLWQITRDLKEARKEEEDETTEGVEKNKLNLMDRLIMRVDDMSEALESINEKIQGEVKDHDGGDTPEDTPEDSSGGDDGEGTEGLVKQLMGGFKTVLASIIGPIAIGTLVLSILMSPIGMAIIAFISAFVKNKIWIPIILPIIEGIKVAIAWVREGITGLVDKAQSIWAMITDIPNIIQNWYDENVKPVIEQIWGFIEPAINTIKTVIGKIFDMYKSAMVMILKGMEKVTFGELSDKIGAMATKIDNFELPLNADSGFRAPTGDTGPTFSENMTEREKRKARLIHKATVERDKRMDEAMRTVEESSRMSQLLHTTTINNTTNQNVAPTVINIEDSFGGEPSFGV